MRKQEEIFAEFRKELNAIENEKKRIEHMLEFAINFGDSFTERVGALLEEAMLLSDKIGFRAGKIIAFYNYHFFYGLTQSGAFSNVKEEFAKEPRVMIDSIKDEPYWYSMGLNLLSYFYWFRGEYEKGFNLSFEAIKYGEEHCDKNLGWHYFSLGIYYFDTKDLHNSEVYYRKSNDEFSKDNHAYGMARSANGIASVYIIQNKLTEALPLLDEAAAVYRKLGHYAGLSRALNDMAALEKKAGNFDRAIILFNEAISLRREIDHVQGLITSLTELGECYLFMGKSGSSLGYFTEGLELTNKANSRQKAMRLHKLLYDVYKGQDNTHKALEHLEKFYELRTTLMGDEASNNIKRIQTNFEKEKSEKEAEIERLRNVELKKAYEMIEQRNKDIHDSINYASRIQRSLLPSDRNIEKMLKSLQKD